MRNWYTYRTVFHGSQHFVNRIWSWGLPSSLSSLDLLLHGCITCNYHIGMSPAGFLHYLFWHQSPKLWVTSYYFAFPHCKCPILFFYFVFMVVFSMLHEDPIPHINFARAAFLASITFQSKDIASVKSL